MIKIRINYVGTESYTEIIIPLTFEKFIEELFKSKIYLSKSDSSFPIAINTRNITSVAQEYYYTKGSQDE